MTRPRTALLLLAALALPACAVPAAASVADSVTGSSGGAVPAAAGAAPAWQLRWAPEPSRTGLSAFETVEDDRAGSHPAAKPHIKAVGDTFRFDMHTVDRDSAADRQRQEVTGMRNGASYLQWRLGETWRVTYSMYVPGSLKATSTFTHIMQTKQPGTGTSPITVTSLRRVGGKQTIEHKIFAGDILVGRTDLEPLQDKWVRVEYEIKIGDGTDGSVRWVIRDGGTTVIDARKTGVDTFLADRVRPKWGIYRSLGDTSGSLQNTYLLLRDMRGYQLTGGTPGPGPTPTPTAAPTGTPAPSPAPTGATPWKAGTAYAVGARVTWAGLTYRCLQAHTALAGWEPSSAPALWQRV
ncbi:carbohydrate-binding protein [Planomonospora sp. ID67723]|uniref:carbohydrate-binding protein n=1 Tax=Planomonospora sp. ID67723 TaxID=2738134 RepID=UPI0018C3531E|nr:carbohydrate-binding protein [Planomonospora sp. ID67723]